MEPKHCRFALTATGLSARKNNPYNAMRESLFDAT
jgi:hypothetical protein